MFREKLILICFHLIHRQSCFPLWSHLFSSNFSCWRCPFMRFVYQLDSSANTCALSCVLFWL